MSDREICAYCKCVKGRYDPCGCRGETAARDVRDLSFRLSRTELERDEARYKAEQNRLKANLADQMRDAAILWKQRACDRGWVDPEPPPLPADD